MVIVALSIFLFLIFTVLGGFHFYWLFGGVWGLKSVIPTKENELSNLSIPKLATLIVGLTLTLFGLLYLVKSGLINVQIPNWIINYGYWFIPSIFILRAIGEFNYVGFFKKIKNTKFSKADTEVFSPLCLIIGIIGILIQLIHI
ncbi:DUF3995 domain-containing protein [uncultured Lacinutrix sp.]|uniref:DUF3995 domain-containing protein n=1 Tax=uncultured Lacinutrix sp. TaxID=574032 RepID=UPI0026125352|nr:DUF3995 domain-containing protein [uncultured Lacinutrix sp.]